MFSFPKSRRLLKRSEFHAMRHRTEEISGRYLRIRIIPAQEAKLGIIVSRHFGKANKRNRFKRLIREGYRQWAHPWPPCHLVVLPRHAAHGATLQELFEELSLLILEKGYPVSLVANIS